jgi:hypothetical protein
MMEKLQIAYRQSRSSAVWLEFREARQEYNKVRRYAMATFEQKEWREFISNCRGDPRALWQKLSGGASGKCPVTDADVWRNHFQALFNDRQKEPDREKAVEALKFINKMDREGAWWVVQGHAESERRRLAADAALNGPITV